MTAHLCDLHTHSTHSDGTYTPAQLIDEAVRLGLSAIALTDHNTVAGLSEFSAAAVGKPIEAVCGIEISADASGTELHILGLFVRPEHHAPINELLEQFKQKKEQSNVELVQALSRGGYTLDYADIKARSGGYVNRAHIAAALMERGYVGSVSEAFSSLLSKSGGFYREPERLSALSVIDFLKSLGITTVLAHPFLNLDEDALRAFLSEAVPHGLDGMETVYSTYDEASTQKAAAIAAEFGLKQSGGSDFHGACKPDISLGTGKGNLEIPLEFLNRFKEK